MNGSTIPLANIIGPCRWGGAHRGRTSFRVELSHEIPAVVPVLLTPNTTCPRRGGVSRLLTLASSVVLGTAGCRSAPRVLPLTQSSDQALSIRAAFTLARATPDDFSRQWDQRYHAAVGAIGIQPGAQSNALKAKWAQGYIDYSFLHWRETGKTTPNNWRASMRAVSSVEVNDSALLVLPEQREFLDAWLRAEARTLLRSRAELQTGDNRWLRARFDVVASKVAMAVD